jgi:hypothetical protein
MKIANIVSLANINVSEDFNVVQSLDDIIQGLPTLIIGWDYVKKHYPDYNIITRELGPNLWWTFKKHEKRDLHEEDIYNFTERTYKNLITDVSYVFVDPIIMSGKKIRKIVKKICSLSSVIAYEHQSMIYLYGEKLIFGIDLSLLSFMNLNVDKLKEKIIKKSSIFLKDESIFIEYKKRVENLDNQVKFIPYLYSIENG